MIGRLTVKFGPREKTTFDNFCVMGGPKGEAISFTIRTTSLILDVFITCSSKVMLT